MEGRIQCCFGGQIHSFKGEVEVPSGAACTILLQPNHPRNVANLQMQPNVAEQIDLQLAISMLAIILNCFPCQRGRGLNSHRLLSFRSPLSVSCVINTGQRLNQNKHNNHCHRHFCWGFLHRVMF